MTISSCQQIETNSLCFAKGPVIIPAYSKPGLLCHRNAKPAVEDLLLSRQWPSGPVANSDASGEPLAVAEVFFYRNRPLRMFIHVYPCTFSIHSACLYAELTLAR